MQIDRLDGNPIIHAGLDDRMGNNINGPSLVRAPNWVANPLGRYYLYFAHHKGDYIRLAYADSLSGSWSVHRPGTLHLRDSHFTTERPSVETLKSMGPRATAESQEERLSPHIASPDVHVDEAKREVRMYFHGLRSDGSQRTRIALSNDGLNFEAREEILGLQYMRVFQHAGWYFALSMPGQVYRSADGLSEFETGPKLFGPDMRHAGLYKRGNVLYVFWTQVGDAPERIFCSQIRLDGGWLSWTAGKATEVLRPQTPWEGGELPVQPSLRGAINHRVAQLRDPAIFEENGNLYLLYAVAGESGIAIAHLTL